MKGASAAAGANCAKEAFCCVLFYFGNISTIKASKIKSNLASLDKGPQGQPRLNLSILTEENPTLLSTQQRSYTAERMQALNLPAETAFTIILLH